MPEPGDQRSRDRDPRTAIFDIAKRVEEKILRNPDYKRILAHSRSHPSLGMKVEIRLREALDEGDDSKLVGYHEFISDAVTQILEHLKTAPL